MDLFTPDSQWNGAALLRPRGSPLMAYWLSRVSLRVRQRIPAKVFLHYGGLQYPHRLTPHAPLSHSKKGRGERNGQRSFQDGNRFLRMSQGEQKEEWVAETAGRGETSSQPLASRSPWWTSQVVVNFRTPNTLFQRSHLNPNHFEGDDHTIRNPTFFFSHTHTYIYTSLRSIEKKILRQKKI